MKKQLVRSAVLGGIIVFIWSVFSWMVLPWHQATLKAFTNESSVASVIQDNAPTSGIYILPNFWQGKSGESHEEARARAEEGKNRMERGPVVFASIRPSGVQASMWGTFLIGVIIQIVAAWIITWMLMQAKGLTYWGKVRFVTLFGLLTGILALLPAWNWWGFSMSYTVVAAMDLIIGWFFGGMVIARFLIKNN